MAEQGSQADEESLKLINIQEYQTNWSELVDFSSDKLEMKGIDLESIAEEIDLPLPTVNDLSAVCSIETLLSGSEPEDKKLSYQSIPPTQLKTLQYQSKDVIRRKESVAYRSFLLRNMKYSLNNTIRIPKGLNRVNCPVEKLVPTPNIILSVDVYRHSVFQRTPFLRDQTVLVRGDMFLSEFRDSIDCVNDLAVAGDFSENLALASQVQTCKETLKSGLLFIEETFYNDTRHADNRDYSKLIIEWMNKNNPSPKHYKTASMETVRFNELSIKLGEPYLYMHQGNCEHIFTISDLRMLTADDSQNIDDYPFVTSQVVRRRVLCKSCLMYTAKWQIEESNLTPIEPCYLCESCLTSLHYDQDGNKVGHFKAFKFADTFSCL